MTKQSGKGDNLYVAGYDLSNDIGGLQRIGGGPTALESTGIDKFALERVFGLRDGSLDYMAYFNPTANRAHDRLSLLPDGSVISTYCRGTALGKPAASIVGKQVGFDPTRGTDASFTFSVSNVGDGYALEWGEQLTAGKRTDTAATNGTGVDFAAATAFGLQAYLHVFSFTGTSCTVKIQESSDNGGGDAFADVVGGGFTAATGITSERIQTARNLAVERYLRVVTTGVFSECTFAVMVVKNVAEVKF